MAAPNFVGPTPPPHRDTGEHEAAGPTAMDDRARAAHIAELAARLAAIESRDQASTSSPMRGSSSAADEPVADRTAKHGSADGASSAVSKRSTGSTGSNRSSGPIGSSGTTGRRREPGGHPEDAPGDPAAVARSICLRLLTGAARPRAELETALRQRGIPDDVAAGVLDRLTEVGLIDDRAYAEAFVAAKHRDRALGSSALRTELRRKGVDDVTVDAAVRTVDSDAELARAKALIERRVDSAMGNGPVAARRRLVGLLARRGYSAEVSARVVDEALAAYGAEQDDGWS